MCLCIIWLSENRISLLGNDSLTDELFSQVQKRRTFLLFVRIFIGKQTVDVIDYKSLHEICPILYLITGLSKMLAFIESGTAGDSHKCLKVRVPLVLTTVSFSKCRAMIKNPYI